MKNNFDLKNFLVENKITKNSKVLNENEGEKEFLIWFTVDHFYEDNNGAKANMENIYPTYPITIKELVNEYDFSSPQSQMITEEDYLEWVKTNKEAFIEAMGDLSTGDNHGQLHKDDNFKGELEDAIDEVITIDEIRFINK